MIQYLLFPLFLESLLFWPSMKPNYISMQHRIGLLVPNHPHLLAKYSDNRFLVSFSGSRNKDIILRKKIQMRSLKLNLNLFIYRFKTQFENINNIFVVIAAPWLQRSGNVVMYDSHIVIFHITYQTHNDKRKKNQNLLRYIVNENLSLVGQGGKCVNLPQTVCAFHRMSNTDSELTLGKRIQIPVWFSPNIKSDTSINQEVSNAPFGDPTSVCTYIEDSQWLVR